MAKPAVLNHNMPRGDEVMSKMGAVLAQAFLIIGVFLLLGMILLPALAAR